MLEDKEFRSFEEDVLRCPSCQGKRSIIAFLDDPIVVHKMLRHLGLEGRPRPARSLPVLAGLTLSLCMSPGCGHIPDSTVALPSGFEIVVRIEDVHAGRFLLDTGSTGTLINETAAKRWGLPIKSNSGMQLTGSSGQTRSIKKSVHLDRLNIGEVGFSPVLAHVLRFPPLLARYDGILGMDILQHRAWIFDVQGKKLHCVSPDRLVIRLSELFPGRKQSRVPFSYEGLRPSVELSLGNDRILKALVDTGAWQTRIPDALAMGLELAAGNDAMHQWNRLREQELNKQFEGNGDLAIKVTTPNPGSTIGILGESSLHEAYLLPKLEFGEVQFGPLLVVGVQDPAAGVLGADVLGRTVWALDAPGKRLFVLQR